MKKLAAVLAATATAALFSASASDVSASTITKQYKATSADGNNADHSLWISGGLGNGIGSDFDFIPAGTLTQYDTDLMSLTGTVVSQSDASASFIVDFQYDKDFTDENSNVFTPKFKSENGSKEVPGVTEYWNLAGGTLTGTGILNGLNLTVERKPPNGPYATQIGPSDGSNEGANNKNVNLGMANWFTISVVAGDCKSKFCAGLSSNNRQGDINIDLHAAPLPAGVLLLLTGIAGFGVARRRKAA